jgi:c(7)-type cytochrome triheme protein
MTEIAGSRELFTQRRPTKLVIFALAFSFVITLPFLARQMKASEQQMQVPENADYSRFKHTSSYHARLPCLLCHRRETNSPRPTMPGSSSHLPCAGCHVKQFADSVNPICAICHTNPQSGMLKPFPRLSNFRMKFDHARHVRMNNLSCSTCHRPTRGGVAMAIPAGLNAHVTCYQCHSAGAKSDDRDISSCAVCHVLGRPARARETTSAFLVGFNHSRHGKSEGLSCNECHQVRAGALRLQVSSPQPLNHHASARAFSCMSCHNGKRAFGGDDFSTCKRCHKGGAWHF